MSVSRRERTKREKRERIMAAAVELFAQRGVSAVTTQEVADRAGVAVGTLYLYASTKAELLIMAQNGRFAGAIAAGLGAAAQLAGQGTLEEVTALIAPVVACLREHVENGRTYLHELVFGDPSEPYRHDGLVLAARLESGVAQVLAESGRMGLDDAVLLARVITAIVHLSTTATAYIGRSLTTVQADIREQISVVIPP